MARPREFEIEDALDAAAKAFWSRGYEATSIEDLMKATGLHKGSLYKAFSSKHDLFKSALEHYLRKIETIRRESIEGEASPKAGLRRWFEWVGELSRDENGHWRGCLAVNTITELGPHDPEVMEVVWRFYGRSIALLTETIARGQSAGEFRADLDAEPTARLLFTVMAGLTINLKAGIPQEQALATADHVLELMS